METGHEYIGCPGNLAIIKLLPHKKRFLIMEGTGSRNQHVRNRSRSNASENIPPLHINSAHTNPAMSEERPEMATSSAVFGSSFQRKRDVKRHLEVGDRQMDNTVIDTDEDARQDLDEVRRRRHADELVEHLVSSSQEHDGLTLAAEAPNSHMKAMRKKLMTMALLYVHLYWLQSSCWSMRGPTSSSPPSPTPRMPFRQLWRFSVRCEITIGRKAFQFGFGSVFTVGARPAPRRAMWGCRSTPRLASAMRVTEGRSWSRRRPGTS